MYCWDSFTHILQDCFTSIGAIIRLRPGTDAWVPRRPPMLLRVNITGTKLLQSANHVHNFRDVSKKHPLSLNVLVSHLVCFVLYRIHLKSSAHQFLDSTRMAKCAVDLYSSRIIWSSPVWIFGVLNPWIRRRWIPWWSLFKWQLRSPPTHKRPRPG